MRVLIVHNREISDFPPVRSLVDALIANKVKTTIITRDENNVLDSYGDKLKVLELLPYASNGNFKNTYKFFENRKLIRKWVKKEMKNNDIIWTTTDATVREIGPDLLNYKHVMQLMELVEYVPKFPLIPKKNLFKFNITKYAHHAWKIVVPEINRAYIQKVWWDLEKTPKILPK